MAAPEEGPFRDAGTATSMDGPRERNVGTMTQAAVPAVCDVRLSFQGPQAAPACSYRLTVPGVAGVGVAPPPARSPTHPAVRPPPHAALSAGQHIASGATDDGPDRLVKLASLAGPAGGVGAPAGQGSDRDSAAAPPDIIAEAGPSSLGHAASPGPGPVRIDANNASSPDERLSAVLRLPGMQQQVFSLEIVRPSPQQPQSLGATLGSSGCLDEQAARSRSLDSLDHGTHGLVVEVGAHVPKPVAECAGAPRKFRLPCLVDVTPGTPPKPSATARAVNGLSFDEAPALTVRPVQPLASSASPRQAATVTPLTSKQRRLLSNLLNVRQERRHRPSPATAARREARREARRDAPQPDLGRQAVLHGLSLLLGEAAVYVRAARVAKGRTDQAAASPPTPTPPPPATPAPPPPPAPEVPPPQLQTSSTQTRPAASCMATQCIADAGAQCSLLAPRVASTLSRASQCTMPARATASSATQCARPGGWLALQPGRTAWEDGDLTWALDDGDRDGLRLSPARKAESMADLGLSWRTRSSYSASLRAARPSVPAPVGLQGLGSSCSRWPAEGCYRCPRRPLTPCSLPSHRHYHGCLAPQTALSSPKQYLLHLVSLRRGIVQATGPGGAEVEGWRWRPSSVYGRPTFPS